MLISTGKRVIKGGTIHLTTISNYSTEPNLQSPPPLLDFCFVRPVVCCSYYETDVLALRYWEHCQVS